MKLTDTFLRGLKANGKARKYSDGGGLYIHVSPVGGRLWRMGYRFRGKQKTLSFGIYPAVSLKTARIRRGEARELLAAGIDPGEHKKALRAALWAETANSFEVVAREWFGKRKDSWAAAHAENTIGRLENHIFPMIGSKLVSRVTASEFWIRYGVSKREALLIPRTGPYKTAVRFFVMPSAQAGLNETQRRI